MNVFSAFDGMACGALALQRLGREDVHYYASEIDVPAITVAMKNFPNIVQMGDINNWWTWDMPAPDLIIGGSPCQGFSIQGDRKNFADPRSALFFVFRDIVKKYPGVPFLLENVRMKPEWEQVITDAMGVEPILLDSSVVSAQRRERLYWTNIPQSPLPADRGLTMADILEPGVERDSRYDKNPANFYMEPWVGTEPTTDLHRAGTAVNLNNLEANLRVYHRTGKAPTLTAVSGGHREVKVSVGYNEWRRLTPVETERLQNVPDNYTAGVASMKRYHMLGNGWTVDLIAHLLKNL